MKQHHDIGSLILAIVFILYLCVQAIWFIEGILNRIAFSSKSKKPFARKIRILYWLAAKRYMRRYIYDTCRYLPFISGPVEVITLYELEDNKYRQVYLDDGLDKLKVSVLTKSEEITKFVTDWKKAYEVCTTEEMLSLYLIENKKE